MARRTSHNRNNHNNQYNSQHSRPGRNQLSYGDDTSAYDDEFSSPRSAQSQSDKQRRTSTRSVDDDRNYWEQHNRQSFRPDRNQLGYGADTSAYDDDYWATRPERSRPAARRNVSHRSIDEDIDYWSEQNFGRGQFNNDRGPRRNNVRYENIGNDDRYSDHRRHVGDDRQPRNIHPDSIDYVRYPDGGPGRGGESRRSRWFEDASFYEYRESRHNPNARRNARYDMEHQDDNYFDRPHTNRNSDADRYDNRRNISDNDYHRHQQRNQSRPHSNERWFDYDEQCRQSRDREERNRNRRW